MKILHKLLGISAILLAAAPVALSQSVLNVSDDSKTPSLIMPRSFETDVNKMLENWYLKNYAVIDHEADKHTGKPVSDEVLLDRLSALPTVIEMPLNAPVRNAINFYAVRKPQLVENMLGLSLYYMPIFEDALERHGLPAELKYLPVIESALMPNAVSPVGAAGLWQFMPATAKGLGLEINSLVDQRRDPYISSDAGARYLKQLYNTFKDWSLAIAAYNCGPGNVNKAMRRAGEGKHDFWEIYPFLPAETRNYLPAFIAANYIMTYNKEHNISPALARRPLVTDTIQVNRRVHFDQISEVMGIPVAELRMLNPQFRTDLIPGDIRPYTLVLPSLQVYAYLANEDSIVNHNADRYARRGIVEPATANYTGADSHGEYYDEEVTQYHTVHKGETLAKIAKKYGVTVESIRKANKVGKSVKSGQKLKIKTVRRRYKPAPAPEPTPAQNLANTSNNTSTGTSKRTAASDSAAEKPNSKAPANRNNEVSSAFANSGNNAPASKSTSRNESAKKNNNTQTQAKANQKPKATQKTKAPATRTHIVAKGENLSKIAKKYGVTVPDIKKANKLSSDALSIGQKLKIPAK